MVVWSDLAILKLAVCMGGDWGGGGGQVKRSSSECCEQDRELTC